MITDNRIFAANNGEVKKQEDENNRLKEVCREFEAIFVQMLLREMRNTVPKNGFFGQSNASEIYQSMYEQALADEISKNGSLGLADQIYKSLSKYV